MRRFGAAIVILMVIALLPSSAGASVTSRHWKLERTPNPPRVGNAYLYGVACPNSQECLAVGTYQRKDSFAYMTLAEFWDGSAWTISQTPNPPMTGDSSLNGISCTSPMWCMAVGWGPNKPLSESWDGSRWSSRSVPGPRGAMWGGLDAVECIDPTNCTSVGSYVNKAGLIRPLVEHWDGSAWSLRHAPIPPSARDSGLAGVSCATAKDCIAVGSFYHQHVHTLVEHWDGSAWSIMPSPDPRGYRYPDSTLLAVSCTSRRACMAVGFSLGFRPGRTIEQTLVERWDGSSWSIEPVRLGSGSGSTAELRGVSCTAEDACTAVGGYRDVNLAERWDGLSWTKQEPPAPPGAFSTLLFGVTCRTRNICAAVGSYAAPSQRTLVDRYIG